MTSIRRLTLTLALTLCAVTGARADGELYTCTLADGSSAVADARIDGAQCELLQSGSAAPAAAAAAPTAAPAAGGTATAPVSDAAQELAQRRADYRDMMRNDVDVAGNPLPAGPLSAQGRRYKMIDKATYQQEIGSSGH